MESEGFTAPAKDPEIYIKNSWGQLVCSSPFLRLGINYTILYISSCARTFASTGQQAAPALGLTTQRRSFVRSAVTPYTSLFCAFTSNMLPTVTHYGLCGSSHRA